jgi:hypothetical protein
MVYETLVEMDEPIAGVRPNMTADVTILLKGLPGPVLAVPRPALIHSTMQDGTCTCFVQTPEGPEKREVVVGVHTDQLAEVVSGLKEGDEVILTPDLLLTESERLDLTGGAAGF